MYSGERQPTCGMCTYACIPLHVYLCMCTYTCVLTTQERGSPPVACAYMHAHVHVHVACACMHTHVHVHVA